MVHKYRLNGFNVVLDVNSGSVHLVDEVVYDLLSYLSAADFCQSFEEIELGKLRDVRGAADLRSAYFEILSLWRAGLLFSEAFGVSEADLEEKLSGSPIKSMCLNVAHDCNLRCRYCFASTGDFGAGRKLMNLEVAKSAVDFLLERSGSRHNLEVDFFGGEPLLNFPVVKETVLYARSLEKDKDKKFRFTLTTNGLLLDDYIINFINDEMDNVVLSIDGRKFVNDEMRFDAAGFGSYESIVPKFQKLVSHRSGKDYYVRGTFTKKNLDFSKDVLHLYSLGFDQISIEPVVSDLSNPFAITESDMADVENEYENLMNKMIVMRKKGKCFNFFHFMFDFGNGPCITKRMKGCGCGNEYIAVTPDGEIFPCHQFVGTKEWSMGNVVKKSFNDGLRREFIKANIFSNEGCADCWAKFFCSGGCSANHFKFNGDIRKPYGLACRLQKKRIECAIFLNLVGKLGSAIG